MCDYCDLGKDDRLVQSSPIFDFHPKIKILKDKRLYCVYEKFVKDKPVVISTYYDINYCPMCGRKLGE